jgi:predicted SAM-dependent methyltransferase
VALQTKVKSFLHVGCGRLTKANTIPYFNSDEWHEVRLDIDPAVAPDILGTMTSMPAIADGTMDGIFSSHNVEHLYPHEVEIALGEFLRVLKPNGFAVITCPDLRSVCQLVAEGKLLETAWVSSAGASIAPLDMLFGFREATRSGNHFMAHKCGFTRDVLMGAMTRAGFKSVAGMDRPAAFDLWVVGRKDELPGAEMIGFANRVLA